MIYKYYGIIGVKAIKIKVYCEGIKMIFHIIFMHITA